MNQDILNIQNKIKSLKAEIKQKENRLTKLNRSFSESLSKSQTAMFLGMNKTPEIFNDKSEQSLLIKKEVAYLSLLRSQLSDAQERADFLEQTKNILPIQF
jgi:hypothetical protein